jgi:hypothetical protein
MLELIKSKGFYFLLRRVKDKLQKRISVPFQIYQDSKIKTYSENISDIQSVNPVYNSKFISVDLMENDQIIALADLICSHKFNLLGSGMHEVAYDIDYNGFEGFKFTKKISGNKSSILKNNINSSNLNYAKEIIKKLHDNYKLIDWQRDFRSGYRWDSTTHFSKITYGSIDGVDVKIPWELGRLNHFIILFYAWKITNKPEYKDEFTSQIYDFTAQNPPKFGVQWSSAMDVALRAVSLVSVYSLFISSGVDYDNDFKRIFYNYLNSHLIFLLNNLEWSSGMRANHYFANICGIIYLCTFLPVTKITSFAFIFALNELRSETLYQFNNDGGNFEASLPYHTFVSEMLFHTQLFINQIPKDRINNFVANYNSDIHKEFSFHNDIIKRINDIKFSQLINDGKVTFDDIYNQKIQKIAAFNLNCLSPNNFDFQLGDNDNGYFFRFMSFINEDFSIQSGNRTELYKISKYLNRNYTPPKSIFMEDFGVFFHRENKYKIAVRCGSVGQNGKGGHAHNDQLSFELYAHNQLLICDAGTYNYTAAPNLRNIFRSTESHNTLQIENYEQNPIPEGRNKLFWMNDTAKAKCLNYSEHNFVGVHYGYPQPHQREFHFGLSNIHCKDICKMNGEKKIYFHLHHLTIIENLSENIAILNCNNTKFRIKSDNGKFSAKKYYYSPEYGVKYSSNLIVITHSDNEINWEIELI